MDNTVMIPTQEILSAADLIDEAVERLIRACSNIGPLGRYEADVECRNLLVLVIRHSEGFTVLARRDLVSLPSAMVICRAAFETAVKILWMLDPDDPFEREARWLAHLDTEVRFQCKIASHLGKSDLSEKTNAGAILRQFHSSVAQRLPAGYAVPRQLPNLFEMLKALGEEAKYSVYLVGCQYAHSTHFATGLYRKHQGTMKTHGESIKAEDWWTGFSMIWYALHASGHRFLAKTGGKPADFLSAEFATRVQDAVNALRGNH